MKTIKISNKIELNAYKTSGKTCQLNMREWESGDIDFRGATTGDIDITNELENHGFYEINIFDQIDYVDKCQAYYNIIKKR